MCAHPIFFRYYFIGNKAKGQISKQGLQNISYLLIHTRTCAHEGVRNIRFSENLTSFVFLKHSFWDSPFHLITDEFTRKLKAKLKSFLRASPSVQLKGSDKRQHCLVPCKFGFDAFGFISLLTLHSYLLHMTLISILFFDITPNDGS